METGFCAEVGLLDPSKCDERDHCIAGKGDTTNPGILAVEFGPAVVRVVEMVGFVVVSLGWSLDWFFAVTDFLDWNRCHLCLEGADLDLASQSVFDDPGSVQETIALDPYVLVEVPAHRTIPPRS